MGHRPRLRRRASALEALARNPETAIYWRLTETVTTCVASGRVLFLDVARDRYLALPPAHEPIFIEWLLAHDAPPPEQCCESLVALNISERTTVGSIRPIECRVAMPAPLDAEALPPVRVSPMALIGVGRSVFSAWRDVRSRRLGSVLARSFPPMPGGAPSCDDVRARLAVYRSARPLIPVPRVCLHDCLALIDWLGPRTGGIELVLGVSPYPFSAHSWVQADGRVIDDHPQSPSRFQPILHFQ